MPVELDFQSVLTALRSEKPFTPRLLAQFSDLGPREIEDLLALWPGLSNNRKYRFLGELAELGEEDSLLSFNEVGLALLKDEDPHVRVLCLRILMQSEDKRVLPICLRMLSATADPDPLVRSAAAATLAQFVEMGELEKIPTADRARVEETLLRVANSGDRSEVRRAALASLGYSSRPEVPALIEAALGREDPDWVSNGLLAAGRSGDDRWAEAVLVRMTDEDADVRLAAVRAAGDLALVAARPALFALLEEEEDDEIFAASVWSLSQIGGPDVRTFLETLLARIVENEEDELAEFVETALDNLYFTDEMVALDLLAVDPDLDLDLADESDEEPDDEPDEA